MPIVINYGQVGHHICDGSLTYALRLLDGSDLDTFLFAIFIALKIINKFELCEKFSQIVIGYGWHT